MVEPISYKATCIYIRQAWEAHSVAPLMFMAKFSSSCIAKKINE